jgi:hypothetical protein
MRALESDTGFCGQNMVRNAVWLSISKLSRGPCIDMHTWALLLVSFVHELNERRGFLPLYMHTRVIS